MSFIKTLSLAALTATTFSFGLACGGGDDGSSSDVDAGALTGTHTQFVINDLIVPSSGGEANNLALDLDGDGVPENALGGLLGALASAAGLDLQTGIDEQLATAAFVLLASVQAEDLLNANGAGTYIFFGENPSPAACTDPQDLATCGKHLDGSGSFDIAANSPTDALLRGNIANGDMVAGPGTVSIELPLGDTPLQIDLIGARLEVTVSADGLMSGKLGGAITCTDVDNKLMPAVQSLVTGLVEDSCTPVGDDCGCESGSTGETVLGFFDGGVLVCIEFEADGVTCKTEELQGAGDCEIGLEELKSQSIIDATLRNPDVDLLENVGSCDEDSDSEDDSLSLAVGFSGVPATFTLPAGI